MKPFVGGTSFVQVAAIGTFVEWHGSLADFQKALQTPHVGYVLTYLVTPSALHFLVEEDVDGVTYRTTHNIAHRRWLRNLPMFRYVVQHSYWPGFRLVSRWEQDQNQHFEEAKPWRYVRGVTFGSRIIWLRWRPRDECWGVAFMPRGFSVGPFEAWTERTAQ